MVAKRSSRAVALLLVVPSAAFALGLGDIRLLSPLDQPLKAQIELLDATPERAAEPAGSARFPGHVRALRPELAAVPERRAREGRAHRRRQGSGRAVLGHAGYRSGADPAGRGQLGPRSPDPRVHRAPRSAGVRAEPVAGRQASRSRRRPPVPRARAGRLRRSQAAGAPRPQLRAGAPTPGTSEPQPAAGSPGGCFCQPRG